MDKYKLALLGEAGAAGLDRGFSIRYKIFRESYSNEMYHWKYFQKYRRSFLEKPVYYVFSILGFIISLFGIEAVKKVNEIVERNAIDFYKNNFNEDDEDIMRILEDEKKHFAMSVDA
ncbi:hypothetical protein SULI_14780 [Saccharolobus solfataricus]|uniref:Uncharacterized protein n=3 Tax=Saccharolobus solfataricus TaxID=2287 RepID=Q7LX50_SACS2|nr:hypothetical protein [Saccharolobus solfataricus]AAK42331.1 Hypothetical protein SSO2155 [Saccharolobus solfataricus P2]AKA74944.1 hypothetical protein SULB_2894 [Saccharolobus solfataricus]AKA77640.1 hypothetical protein SULC_2891 [Saccharolobus solfataricus]AKA80331.1 hypothetical protein SULA_2894 [Saccharolobus solfataricus]AZF69409.1 hypothetical protein SULG_14780 [Saccharolobus solfataricus]